METTDYAEKLLILAGFIECSPSNHGYDCDRLFIRKRMVNGSYIDDTVRVWGMIDRKQLFFAAVGTFGSSSINEAMLEVSRLEAMLQKHPK